jgi:hypothetical protein
MTPEAEFLDVIRTKFEGFPPCYSKSPILTDFFTPPYPPPPPILGSSDPVRSGIRLQDEILLHLWLEEYVAVRVNELVISQYKNRRRGALSL